jgi:hypothetical protein
MSHPSAHTRRVGLALCGLSVALFAALLGPDAWAGGGSDLSAKAASKAWKKALGVQTKAHKLATNLVHDTFFADLSALQLALEVGQAKLVDAMPVYFLLLETAQQELIETTSDVGAVMQSDGVNLLDQLAPTTPASGPPIDFLRGTGGQFDKALAKLEQNQQRAIDRMLKKLLAFHKKLAKKAVPLVGSIHMSVPDTGRLLAPNATAQGGAPPLLPRSLSLDLIVGASDGTDTNDGKLCLAGNALPGEVFVTLTGPSGILNSSTTAGPTGRWFLCFGGTQAGQAGNLPEGNYKLDVTTAGGALKATLGLP